jgi:hypothetical protein
MNFTTPSEMFSRAVLGQGTSIITCTCTVETPDEIASKAEADFTLIQNLPDDVLHYLLPSRSCESDKMLKLADRETMCRRLSRSRSDPQLDLSQAAIQIWRE